MGKRTYWLITAYLILIVLFGIFTPRETDWRPSFSKLDKIPYGNYILGEEIGAMFPQASIRTNEAPFYNLYYDTTDLQKLLLITNKEFLPDPYDLDALLDFVANGHNCFISAEIISDKLLDTLNVAQNTGSLLFSFDDIRTQQNEGEMYFLADYPGLSWPSNDPASVFPFEIPDSTYEPMVRGMTEDSLINFISASFGDGKFFIHNDPFMFTNDYVLESEPGGYISAVLNLLSGEEVIWDEYYKVGRPDRTSSPMKVLMQFRGFRWAYWLGLVTIFLYLIFHGKRKQKIIPIVKAEKNTSLDFIKVLGDMYFQRQDFPDLSRKKILFFRDFLRKKYRLNDIRFDEREIELITQKTGQKEQNVRTLLNWIQKLDTPQTSPKSYLVRLNELLNPFYSRTEKHD